MCRILSFFRTLQVLYVISQIRTREGEYEDSDSVIYEYEPDYECVSLLFLLMTCKYCFGAMYFGID